MNKGDVRPEQQHFTEKKRANPERLEQLSSDRPVSVNQEHSRNNLVILENNESTVSIAGYVGGHYSRKRELVRVRLDIEETKYGLETRIAEFWEVPYARALRRKALQEAELLATKRGVKIIRRIADEKAFQALRPGERGREIEDLHREGYSLKYISRDNREKRRLVILKPGDADQVVGEPLAMQAEKDLGLNPPRSPDKVQIRDIVEVRSAEHVTFREQIEQAETRNYPSENLELPTSVEERMSELWEKSTRFEVRPPMKVREYGGTLIERMDGSIVLAHERRGDAGSVNLDLAVSEGEKLVGTIHTHPYEDGQENMAFSGTDVASFLSSREIHVTVVQSGDAVFALTKAPDVLKLTSGVQHAAVSAEIDANFNQYVAQRRVDKSGQQLTFKDYSEAALAANIDACEKYGLHLYVGKLGKPLQRIYP